MANATWCCKTLAFAVQGHAAARPAFESLLAAAEARLHPMHVVAFDTLMPLVNCCRQAGDGAGAIKHLSRMLDTMDAICGLPTVEVRSFRNYFYTTLVEGVGGVRV